MEAQQTVPKDEALKYINAWKDELDLRQKEINTRLFSGAVGGVVTIAVSAGLALDKVAVAGLLVRVALGVCVFLLLLGAGNIMNCFRLAVDGQLALLADERQILLSQPEAIPQAALHEMGERLTGAIARSQVFYRYSYVSIALAIVLGAITFIGTLLWI